jgi:hypothetical protein
MMLPWLRLAAVLMLLGTAGSVHADEPAKHHGPSTKHRIVRALVIEGFAAANSGIAAQNPRAYGIGALSLMPVSLLLTGTDRRGILTGVDGALLFAAIGGYNLTLDDDTLSENEIFGRNMIAWNVAVLAIWAGRRVIASDRVSPRAALDSPSSWQTHVAVSGNGARLSLTREF